MGGGSERKTKGESLKKNKSGRGSERKTRRGRWEKKTKGWKGVKKQREKAKVKTEKGKKEKKGKKWKNMEEKTRDIGNSFYNSIQAMKQWISLADINSLFVGVKKCSLHLTYVG